MISNFLKSKTMKNKIFILAALFATLFVACNDADYSAEDNKLFIEETGVKANQRKVYTMESEAVELTLTPRLSSVLSNDVGIKILVDTDHLEEFNKQNGTAYKPLPASGYALSQENVTIEAGRVTPSGNITIKVETFTEDMVNSGDTYALPIRIVTTDANSSVVEGADRIVYALDLVRYADVPVFGVDRTLGGHRKGMADYRETPLTLENWTVEFRLHMDSYSINNQAVFNGGGDTELYVRYGDAPIPYNQFQVKFGGSQINSFMGEVNKWHHIAMTYDGTNMRIYLNGNLQGTMDNPGHVMTLNGRTAVISSGTTYFRAQAMMNEVRIWNVARSESEIKENFYVVSPQAEGLVSYWKMNEGEGTEFKNSIAGAPDMIAHDANENPVSNMRWVPNVKLLND